MTARSTDGLQRAVATRALRRALPSSATVSVSCLFTHLYRYLLLNALYFQSTFSVGPAGYLFAAPRPAVGMRRGHHVAREKHAAHRPPNTCCGNLLTQFQRPTASLAESVYSIGPPHERQTSPTSTLSPLYLQPFIMAPAQCTVCKAAFKSKNECNTHRMTAGHSLKAVFFCVECSATFAAMKALKTHQKETGHPKNAPDGFAFSVAGPKTSRPPKTAPAKSAWAAGPQKVPPAVPKCSACNERFETFHELAEVSRLLRLASSLSNSQRSTAPSHGPWQRTSRRDEVPTLCPENPLGRGAHPVHPGS